WPCGSPPSWSWCCIDASATWWSSWQPWWSPTGSWSGCCSASFRVPPFRSWLMSMGLRSPSRAISALAITLYAMTFVLVPRGRGRNRLRAGFTAGLVVVVLAELYLAADYLSAMVYAAILAPCVADVAFRWLVPEEGFPLASPPRGSPPPP